MAGKREIINYLGRDAPGPGSYDPNKNKVLGKTSFDISFSSKLSNNLKKSDLPGPGKYELNNTYKDSSKSFKFSSSIRKIETFGKHSPSPVSYNPNYESISKISVHKIKFDLSDLAKMINLNI